MAALCSFLVLVVVSIGYVLSSAITNDTSFYWQQLSTYFSISATIEFSVQYNISLWGTLVLDIYTFEEGDRGPEHECSNRRCGQLGNRNLHRFLISPQTPCEEMMDNNEMMVSCNGKIKISHNLHLLGLAPDMFSGPGNWSCTQKDSQDLPSAVSK